MAQRNQYNLQGQSIDSTIADSPSRSGPSGWHGNANVNDDGSEGAAILPDIERSASPSTSTWSSENPENPFNTAQSADFAAPQRAESTITSSESDSLSRSHDTPRSLSNQSGQFRGSYAHKPSFASLEILQEDFPTLTNRQDTIPSDLPRLPTLQELRVLPVTTHLIPPRSKESVKNIIIVLHDHSGDENVLQDFAEQNLHPKNTACLLLRGVSAIPGEKDSYQWEENNDDFFKSSKIILEDLIMNLLKSKCNIPERKIIIFGQGEGAAAALTTFSTWKRVEFGGVVCVGGYLPPYAAPSGDTKSKTAVLLLGGELGTTNPVAKNRIEQIFSYVDCDLLPGKDDALPRSKQQLKSLKSFFCHRLHEEEWTKPAVITFDGGGIRGYGSLLILQALMNRIGAEERRLDQSTESSFYPCMYKPRSREPQFQHRHIGSSSREDHDSEESTAPVATPTAGLPNSSLFLPCHYFQYVGGTSTGGLVSIMISRFRMTVDDCLHEYRTLGSDVFGKPRLFTLNTLLWDKFNEKRLRKAIEDVTFRHCEDPRVTTTFPSPDDLCHTTVVAYNDKGTLEDPYLIRTFETFATPKTPTGAIRRSSSHKTLDIRNPGHAQQMDIPTVGRATTAAPGYFKHLTTKIGNTTLRFKDGGFGCNNPSWETFKDIKALLVNGSKDMGPFISIGTGVSDVPLFPTKPGHLRHRWTEFRAVTKGLPTRTKGAHDSMMHAAYRDNQKRFHYSRFDGGSSLGVIPMDEWIPSDRTGAALFTGKHKNSGRVTIKKIEDAITLYLGKKEVQDELDYCAKILVRRRRLQTRNESKWERFALACWYICPYKGCPQRRQNTLDVFKAHVRRFHPGEVTQTQLDAEAQLARRCWLYRDHGNGITSHENDAGAAHDGPDVPGINPASTFGSIEG